MATLLHNPWFAPLKEMEQSITTVLDRTRGLPTTLGPLDKVNNGTDDYSKRPCALDDPISEYIVPVIEKYKSIDIAGGRAPLLETAFKLKFLQIQNELAVSMPKLLDAIFQCLDLLLRCSERSLVDDVTPLNCLEEIFEYQTIEASEQIYNYLESRVDRLTMNLVVGKGKGLTLLRLCNDLLRRLSKDKNAVLCGRILMLLTGVLPLKERSGVNLRGEFNLDNITLLEGDDGQAASDFTQSHGKSSKTGEAGVPNTEIMDVDEDPNTTRKGDEDAVYDDSAFYRQFWGLQAFFCNPTTLGNSPENMTKFRTGIEHTLDKFAAVEEAEQKAHGQRVDASGSADSKSLSYKDGSSTPGDSVSTKRKHFSTVENTEKSTTYFPKFLTSSKLLKLEISDPYFRKHILVQFLIIIQYLESHSTAAAEAYSKLQVNKHGSVNKSLLQGSLNKSLMPHWFLEDDDREWAAAIKPRIFKQLKSIGLETGDRNFLKTVDVVLDRDSSWVQWKVENCQEFERPPLAADDIEETQAKRRKLSERLKPFKQKLGCANLSQLWKDVEDDDSGLGSNWTPQTIDGYLPSVPMIAKRDLATRKMQGRPPPSEQELKDLEQTRLWKALRLGTEKYLDLYQGVASPGYTLSKLIEDIRADEEWEEEIRQNNGKVPKKPELKVDQSTTTLSKTESSGTQELSDTATVEKPDGLTTEKPATADAEDVDITADVKDRTTRNDIELAELDSSIDVDPPASDINVNNHADSSQAKDEDEAANTTIAKDTGTDLPMEEVAPIVISLK
ncbi:hypothetical protein BX616_006052 [Lobosporangium transversale]|uniref:THO complex subunit 1 transcription elongation factor-domain-containing protein n=1 Tax=Lobosporangium transversale TaxID=64571 RepID=A0A1Y2G500_9FUNG|nr:THO complex subunit 1 transcription elongation factor-domain-containing protein [Lobosporangium transversale]KAF9915486.1 hypothetical protein BX616_006052 [Lobosporangium transversale]ORY93664.1 THO complex subunit 1 transcription elongation factor-domain-containing protein [Lobosporangium transversale]|eukprot:XP_021875159.1 THO complex subunit 1 transcription elongation factor-domain-containing protein [Lobosporangium transversale]